MEGDRRSRGKKKTAERQREGGRCRVLIGVMCSWQFFVMTLTKAGFHCEMRYPACEKVTPSTWMLYVVRDKIINLYKTSKYQEEERGAEKNEVSHQVSSI